jgi:alpha-tubulin suppressor-like RCC1 family protein/surface antigen
MDKLSKFGRRLVAVVLAVVLVSGVVGMLGVVPAAAAFTTTPMLRTGNGFNCVLRQDGTVWTWGQNTNGQLGDGTKNGHFTPKKVANLAEVDRIEVSGIYAAGYKSDGTVWGNIIAPGDDCLQITGNVSDYDFSVLKHDGTVWRISRLDNSMYFSGIDSIVSIASYGNFVHFLKNDGTVLDNSGKQVAGISNVIRLFSYTFHSIFAVKNDGTVWAWGTNYAGQLGIGSIGSVSTPVQIAGMENVKDIIPLYENTIFLKNNGTVWACGKGERGILGNGTITDQLTPKQVPGISNITSVYSIGDQVYAIDNNGSAYGWGPNGGNLGDGTMEMRFSPVEITGLKNTVSMALGGYQNIAYKTDGTVWTWGPKRANSSTLLDTWVPVQVKGENGVGYFNVYDNGTIDPPPSGETRPINTDEGLVIVDSLTVDGMTTKAYYFNDTRVTQDSRNVDNSSLEIFTGLYNGTNYTEQTYIDDFGLNCASLVKRYYKQHYGKTITGLTSWFNNETVHRDFSPADANVELREVAVPKVGDIVAFKVGENGHWGDHWALVKSVAANGQVTIIEQNYTGKTSARLNHVLTANEGRFYRYYEPPEDTIKRIFGTKYESTFWNWFKFIVFFGWIWMWFI